MDGWHHIGPKFFKIMNGSQFEQAIAESVSNPAGAFFKIRQITTNRHFRSYNPESVLVTSWNPTCHCNPPDCRTNHWTEHVGLSARQLAQFVGAPAEIVHLVNSVTKADKFEEMDLSQSIDILKGFPEFLRPTGTVSDWLKRDKSGTSMLIYWASTGRWQKGDIMLKAYRNPYSLDWNNPEVIEAFELLGALLAAKSGRSAAIKRDLACNILCAALELKQRAGITGNQSEAKRKLRQLKDNEYKKFVRTGEEISYNILGKIHPRLLAQNQECSVLKRLSHRCSRKHLFHEVPLACDTLKKMIAMANLHSCHMKRRLNPHFFRELTKIWASIPYSFQDYHYNSVLIESLESVLSELLTWVIHSLSGVLSSSHGGCTPLVLTQEYSRGLLPIIYPFQFLILLNWSLRRGQDNFKRRGYLERLAAEVPQFLENCLGNLYDFLLHFCLSPKGHTLPLVPLFAWTLSQLRHPPLVGGSYQKWILRPSDTPERDEAVKVLMVHLASSTIGNRSLYSRRYKVARESR